MKQQLWFLAIVLTASLALLAAQEPGSRQVEWLYYGGDPANTKYSPLADITLQNRQRYRIAAVNWLAKLNETSVLVKVSREDLDLQVRNAAIQQLRKD